MNGWRGSRHRPRRSPHSSLVGGAASRLEHKALGVRAPRREQPPGAAPQSWLMAARSARARPGRAGAPPRCGFDEARLGRPRLRPALHAPIRSLDRHPPLPRTFRALMSTGTGIRTHGWSPPALHHDEPLHRHPQGSIASGAGGCPGQPQPNREPPDTSHRLTDDDRSCSVPDDPPRGGQSRPSHSHRDDFFRSPLASPAYFPTYVT